VAAAEAVQRLVEQAAGFGVVEVCDAFDEGCGPSAASSPGT
jgi:hypothetical protein